jgi:hypothetical protein
MSIPFVGPIIGTVASVPLGILQGIGQIVNGNGPKAQAAAQEQAEFSRTAKVMNAASRAGVEPSPEGLSLTDLRAKQSELLAELQAELGKIFQEAGVSPEQRVVLQSNVLGNLGVANDFPGQFNLNSLLAQRPELEEPFQQLAAVTSLIRATEAASAAGKPDAQGVATYLDAFAPAPGRLLLSMQNGAGSVQYT